MRPPENHFEWTVDGKRRRWLVVGALGAGMQAAAEILVDAGNSVIGMDSSIAVPRVTNGFPYDRLLPWAESPPDRVDACVITGAVSMDAPLFESLRRQHVPVFRLPEFLATVFRSRRQICVAGTHGKSTTTGMLDCLLRHAQGGVSCFSGAVQQHSNRSGVLSSGETVVVESCEWSGSFLHYSPDIAVLTGIERDHFDCFPDRQSEDAAFSAFVQRLSPDGTVVFPEDCRRSAAVAQAANCRRITWKISDSATTPQQCSRPGRVCVIPCEGRQLHWTARVVTAEASCQFRLNVPGLHNLRNAAAALAAAHALQIPLSTACAGLSLYFGARRRFEVRGEYRGITLVDDYAHHPTAVASTLQTARDVYPGRRLLAVLEPHQLLRTRQLFQQFAEALLRADEVYLLPVFPARENAGLPECSRVSGQLVKAINQQGGKAFLFASLDQIVSRIDHSARTSDVLLTMGAGRTHYIHDQLIERLRRNSVA